MSYDLKTLIVFDTNSLRSTEAGDVAYSAFSFGKPYDIVEQFIKENGLDEEVTLAVPVLVIDELKQQKERSYQKDIQELKRIFQRLTGLPHIHAEELKIPDETFNCAEHIESEARKYITANGINLLELRDEHAPSMLKNMLAKVVGHETPKSPFAISSKHYRDAGFKDSVIWEALMHFESVKNFDKVIFLTKDGDYKENCIEDFKAKWQRHIEIFKDENLVTAELRKDYGNYIENRKVYEYAQTEYFDDYLKGLLTPATYIEFDGENLKIENYAITKHCVKVERILPIEGDFVSPVIISEIIVYATRNAQKIEIPVSAKTFLSDFEYMDTEETTFDPNIS